jgi:hypothetical protein
MRHGELVNLCVILGGRGTTKSKKPCVQWKKCLSACTWRYSTLLLCMICGSHRNEDSYSVLLGFQSLSLFNVYNRFRGSLSMETAWNCGNLLTKLCDIITQITTLFLSMISAASSIYNCTGRLFWSDIWTGQWLQLHCGMERDWRAVTIALLEPIHTLQSIFQLMGQTESTAQSLDGQV